jgi:hypothetical protein
MKVINLYGAPCTGKSTFAAGLFFLLKKHNVIVELVGEKTKPIIFSGATKLLDNQLYLTALQYRNLKNLESSQIDVCISDSPLLLQYFYGQHLHYAQTLNKLTEEINQEFDNINILITRKAAYQTYGRCHTEEESKAIEERLLSFAPTLGIHLTVEGSDAGFDKLADYVLNQLKV